jgi:ABC-2 type transport system permease protein
MMMSIAAFELRKRLSAPSTYLYFLAFFTCGLLVMLATGGAFSIAMSLMGDVEKVHVNSPFALQAAIALLSNLGTLVSAAIFGQAVYQDYDSRCDALFFTAPIRPSSYLAGRYLGALLFVLFIFSGIGLGLWVGTRVSLVDGALFGPNHWLAYLWPYFSIVIPNVAFTGAIFFSLATLLRRMTPVYTGAVILIVGYAMAGSVVAGLEHKTLAGLIDPFGATATSIMTSHWTAVEKDAQIVPLDGILLGNRLLWMGVALALLIFTLYRFRRAQPAASAPRRAAETPPLKPTGVIPKSHPQPEQGLTPLLGRLTWLAFKETVKNVYFGVIVLAGVLLLFVLAWQPTGFYDGKSYPVTYLMLDLTGGLFSVFILIIITYYSGELVWRERDARLGQISDALPVPTWLLFLSKLLALLLVLVMLQALVAMSGLAIQTAKGYHHYELGLYVKELFGMQLIHYGLLCVLALSVQTLLQNRYLGHFIMVLYYLWTLFAVRVGFGNHLYTYAAAPRCIYSDMNGYGHFLRPVLWFDAYWSAFALLLAAAAYLLWPRGSEVSFRARLPEARRRYSPRLRLASAVALAGFMGLGAFIFYNTSILNEYRTAHDDEVDQADYEKHYKQFASTAQPSITAVKVAFDLFPEERRLRARGTYTLQNKTAEVIKAVYVSNQPMDRQVQELAIGAHLALTRADPRLGFYSFDLKQPLEPGATVTLDFDVTFHERGFKNDEEMHQGAVIVENGTFLLGPYLPIIGYQRALELSDDNVRRQFALPPRERLPDLDDRTALINSGWFGWASFDATVSTSADQIALTPGYLQRTWMENGRRYFHYTMDGPARGMTFALMSARYAVKRDNWKGVALEIYYQPGHEYNLERMMQGMKDSLDYCTTHFGPYPHRQLRIVEFPRYQFFAAALPNTIPYSESIGFIWKSDPRNPRDIDVPYYVTAHEVGHQWWGLQVVGANVQGETMLTESMAQYTALMVAKKTYGPQNARRFLQHELEGYLEGRSFERKRELPLLRVEGQGYIRYQKGSLVMYALQDYIGEDNLNGALARYVSHVKYQDPPRTTSRELLRFIAEVTPPQLQYILDDLFENITLYDNRALSATYRRLPDGRYELKLRVAAKKLRADGLGNEHEAPLNDLIDVGALDANGTAIAIEKRWIRSNETEVTLLMDRAPVTAGIDPLNQLVDRRPDDNVIRAVRQERADENGND